MRRLGLRERLDSDGRVLLAPSSAEIERILRATVRSGAESIAICLLFSFVNPAHKKVLARAPAGSGLPVSVSHEILPEYREFERTSTTVVNAYLVPVMSGYLSEIVGIAKAQSRSLSVRSKVAEIGSAVSRVSIMQSNGGILSARAAAGQPVRTILSGPAGGVLGAQYVAAAAYPHLLAGDLASPDLNAEPNLRLA